MLNQTMPAAEPDQAPLPHRELAWRTAWIAARLLAGYCLAKQVSPFFYAQF